MSEKDTEVNATELSGDTAFERGNKDKNIHQYFTLYFIAILFIFIFTFSI